MPNTFDPNALVTTQDVIDILDELTTKADARFAPIGGGGGGSDDEALFKHAYGLCSSDAVITTNASGNTVITKTDNDNLITSVATIVETSSTVTTITNVITPTSGTKKYTRTTTITDTGNGHSITNRYVTSNK